MSSHLLLPDMLRAPTVEDTAAIVDLYAVRRPLDAEEVRSWFRNATLDVDNDFRVLERPTGIAGYADVHREGERASLDWTARDSDAGEALLGWAESRARELAVRRILAWSWDPEDVLVGAMLARGYRPSRTSLHMRVSLDSDLPEPAWPDGIDVRAAMDRDERIVHEVIQAAFADTTDYAPLSYDEWSGWALDEARFDRTLWFLASHDDAVIGVVVCEFERAGEVGLGWVESLAVRREWRHHGVGTALLLHAFRSLRERGRIAVGLSVDAENPTGAVRVYESVGMRPARKHVHYEKELT